MAVTIAPLMRTANRPYLSKERFFKHHSGVYKEAAIPVSQQTDGWQRYEPTNVAQHSHQGQLVFVFLAEYPELVQNIHLVGFEDELGALLSFVPVESLHRALVQVSRYQISAAHFLSRRIPQTLSRMIVSEWNRIPEPRLIISQIRQRIAFRDFTSENRELQS